MIKIVTIENNIIMQEYYKRTKVALYEKEKGTLVVPIIENKINIEDNIYISTRIVVNISVRNEHHEYPVLNFKQIATMLNLTMKYQK
jgi:hypothetical protein